MSAQQGFASSPVKASSIIGTNVVNPKGDSLGDIKEIVIDPPTGRVAYAVVSFGGTSRRCALVKPHRISRSSTSA